MTKISERWKHNGITKGYCNICGKFDLLTKDHVPPKCAITLGPVLQKTVSEFFNTREPVKPLNAKNGSYFRTICSNCNNFVLGGFDKEIEKVTKDIKEKLNQYMTGFKTSPFINVPFESIPFTKAMIGHILSATSVEDCKKEPTESPFYSPLKDYVLGKTSSYEDSHDIYYWFYPHRMHISAQSVAFMNDGHIAFICALHFFPIGFIITKKNEGTYPAHSTKLNINDKFLTFNMTSVNYEYTTFPFVRLKNNQMYAMSNGHTCVSYPIIK
ncbi:chaperonin [Enterobacter roggenkampii]|uniref:chaperonin n=1 Tax=Enterobacter roggenkampii TaxID=1812935 RepID=UPI0020041D85|nr:chaperonin [Enterobacter roggenkampii]MCK7252855.1 chaperonin [Enterobacter roggenkampii]